ncbi:semaphorin-4E-like isoform X2 [Synchiropus splendidus]|uniref:semaphorin-4E-like isoform X2 n=1 Tax=Synchiropus splendidus TaxID=270530 RepID=UPI00237E326D|nr:semaphorin-4E-like isoform X2 [Synchiropus splendidus]
MTPLQPFFLVLLLLLLPLASTLEPRRFLPYDSDNTHTFHEEGVFDYSTMLLREDLDLLVVGASGMLYALHLNDISKKNDSVKWDVTPQQVSKCEAKTFHAATDCRNQIKTLLKTQDDRMLVCGTNALDPRCDHMSYVDGKLTLEGKEERGTYMCPSDPSESSASLMIGNNVYSATGCVFSRSLPNFVRTLENKDTFSDPKFVAMEMMPESENSDTGDDDKIYLFFSEKGVDYQTYKPMLVSCVARVCKGDLGGQDSFRERWTSFIKARLQCPVPESKWPLIIQDTYRWCDPQQDWKSCLFFAVFTSQTSSPGSAVCVYSVTDISREFSEGQFMTRVGNKWPPYNEALPVPRPGSCIDNAARKAGINQSLLLPYETIDFIQSNPIMKDNIQPVGGKASLVTQRGEFTRIIVDQVQTTDGDSHHVMFIGTKKGTILKAVNYDGEMFIIQEVQVFKTPEPIKILKFSSVRRQIYAGSDSGVVQVSASSCGRSLSCVDCVLARDPYCGWDQAAGRCTALSAEPRRLLQSVKEGNTSLCHKTVQTEKKSLAAPGYLKLLCSSESKLATIRWEKDHSPLVSSPHRLELEDGLLILNVSKSDAGLYRCLSVERSREDEYITVIAQYNVTMEEETREAQVEPFNYPVLAQQIGLVLAIWAFFGILIWNFYKGYLRLPCMCSRPGSDVDQESPECTNSKDQPENEENDMSTEV